MMQPLDTLGQLTLCCGLGNRRREFKPSRNYFYSPSTALLDPGNSWSQYGQPQPQPQPYFLLTQPVIITNNPSVNPMNTITLVQHAQSGIPGGTNHFPNLSILGAPSDRQQQPQSVQSNIIASQYAVYNSTTPMNNILNSAQACAIYGDSQANSNGVTRNQSAYLLNKPMLPIMRVDQQSERKPPALNSEIFRQLEVIEKQVDLSREIELVERHGITTTRTLDPYSLMSEALLRKYHERFLSNDESTIKFVEIVKRPGQTLGLYIRSIHFENTRSKGTRAGLIITKIDTDSPIYNNQVLHVGDEILSINLIDIEGMSLDDVVILMSIPKRLVLALRVPRERDRLHTNMIQQQHLLKDSLKPQENLLPSGFRQHSIQRLIGENSYHAQIPNEIENRTMRVRELISVSCNDSQLNEMKEELRQNSQTGFLSQDEVLYSGQPSRVQSVVPSSEMHALDIYNDRTRMQEHLGDQPKRYSEDFRHWGSIQNFSGNVRPMVSNRDNRVTNHFEQQTVAFKPEESLTDRMPSNIEFQDFDHAIPEEVGTIQESTMRKMLSPDPARSQGAYNNNEKRPIATPVTLPRRTLPTRPDALSSPTTTFSIKQPVISSLRLSDTPEQSSYFSSSIDAINRELKELRRQRLALNENDRTVESSNA